MDQRAARWFGDAWRRCGVLVAVGLVASVQPPTGARAADEPAVTTTAPEPADAPTDDWLAKLEARGDALQSLTARLRWVNRQELLDDEQTRYGTMHYQPGRDGTPDRLAVHLDRQAIDGGLRPIDRQLVFDGVWLLDLDADRKQGTRRQVAAEGAVDAGAAAESPLPLPLRVNADELRRRFEVAVREVDRLNGRDVSAVVLELTPRDVEAVGAGRVEAWFDRDTLLPLGGSAEQTDGDVLRIDVVSPVADAALPEGVFDTVLPDRPGWEMQAVPLDE